MKDNAAAPQPPTASGLPPFESAGLRGAKLVAERDLGLDRAPPIQTEDISDRLAEIGAEFLKADRSDRRIQIVADATYAIWERDEIVAALTRERDQARAERDELQRSFDLSWEADMRGIKLWQASGEGRELTWPDHAKLVAWLLGERDQAREALAVNQKRVHTYLRHFEREGGYVNVPVHQLEALDALNRSVLHPEKED